MSRVSYESLNRRWLSGHDTRRNADSLYALKWLLICLLSFLAIYLVIITAIGYKDSKPVPRGSVSKYQSTSSSSKSEDTSIKTQVIASDGEFKKNAPLYFRISSGVSLAVVLLSIFGVIRESPLLAMLSSTFMLVGVAQSVSQEVKLGLLTLVSPMLLMSVIGLLLAIYTSLIWSSEFETPPEIIEEYRWYLSPIRGPDVWTAAGTSSSNTNGGGKGNANVSKSSSSEGASTPFTMAAGGSGGASCSGHRLSLTNSLHDLTDDKLNDHRSRQSLISTSTSTAYYSSCE